ncbi:MAG: nucleotidyltransferase domain-containing protein [Nanoarchaeota archaeon]|nr:nucleotidyltransferase domain-containing protein [Nanoarchaeota archaeon]
MVKKEKGIKKSKNTTPVKIISTLKLADEKDIAMDFATKVYQKFDKLVKSIILFGSQAKNTAVAGSDIDIIILVDDASIKWDQELMAWYREELGKIIRVNPYKKELHINSIKLTTWWQDLMRGDPVIINIIRFGEPIIDFGGFFTPLRILLEQGKIKSTPEAIYTALQRTPAHLARSRASSLNSIEGLYWAMVDSAHAAIMATKQTPPSPEHISIMLKDNFVDKGYLKMKYVIMYRDLYVLHRKIIHGDINILKGADLDLWQEKAEEFAGEMVRLVREIIEKSK